MFSINPPHKYRRINIRVAEGRLQNAKALVSRPSLNMESTRRPLSSRRLFNFRCKGTYRILPATLEKECGVRAVTVIWGWIRWSNTCDIIRSGSASELSSRRQSGAAHKEATPAAAEELPRRLLCLFWLWILGRVPYVVSGAKYEARSWEIYHGLIICNKSL